MTLPRLRLLTAGGLMLGLAVSAASQTVNATECGTDEPIAVALMTWPSAEVLAHVAKTVLETGYGCSVDLSPGNTIPTGRTIMNLGTPHVVPEFWISLIDDKGRTALEKVMTFGADVYHGGAEQGLWVPDYFYDAHPDIRAITDLKPNANDFVSQDASGKGQLYSCPPGWGCAIVNANLFRALELNDSFDLVLPGSVSNLSRILARKTKRQEPFVVYKWSPTVDVASFNLVKLDAPPYNPSDYACLTDAYCEAPKVSGWKPAEVTVAVMEQLESDAPQPAAAMLKMSIPDDVILDVLKRGYENDLDPKDMAAYFLKTYEEVWSGWVTTDAAAGIKAGLN